MKVRTLDTTQQYRKTAQCLDGSWRAETIRTDQVSDGFETDMSRLTTVRMKTREAQGLQLHILTILDVEPNTSQLADQTKEYQKIGREAPGVLYDFQQ